MENKIKTFSDEKVKSQIAVSFDLATLQKTAKRQTVTDFLIDHRYSNG